MDSKVKRSKAKYGSEGTSTPVAVDDSGDQSVDQSKNGSSPLFTSAESVSYDGFKSEEKQSKGKKSTPVAVDDSGENSVQLKESQKRSLSYNRSVSLDDMSERETSNRNNSVQSKDMFMSDDARASLLSNQSEQETSTQQVCTNKLKHENIYVHFLSLSGYLNSHAHGQLALSL